MSTSTSSLEASKSGIETTSSGERHIPASVRPDGSLRKEIRVRPGYRPPEDVEVYKNRAAETFKSRGKGGVPGATFVNADGPRPKTSKPAKKVDPQTKQGAGLVGAKNVQTSTTAVAEPPKEEPLDPEAEKEKEAKRLAKRLRQARDLEQKKAKGDALLPEQFEKVIKMNELIRQLDRLGFDAEGQKKP